MANLPRKPLPGDSWTESTLEAFNISFECQDALTFFGHPLPEPTVKDELIECRVPRYAIDDITYSFVAQTVAAVADKEDRNRLMGYVQALLQICDYVHPRQVIYLHHKCILRVANELTSASIDVSLLSKGGEGITLVVLLDGDQDRPRRRWPSLVAAAIAVCQWNSSLWERFARPFRPDVIPCILFCGTVPTFFKVPVTADLAGAVKRGEYPQKPTVVTFCSKSGKAGAMLPKSRRIIIQQMLAFKEHVAVEFLDELNPCSV